MDHTRFWALIDAARAAKGDTAAALERSLRELDPEEILAFDGWLSAYESAVHREDLWAAAFLIRGGCGDDSFDYFCGWLVSKGERELLRVVHDPQALGDHADPITDEAMLYVTATAYEHAAGAQMPVRTTLPAIPGRDAWPADRIARGLKWTNAFFREHYPKLLGKYGHLHRELPVPPMTRERFWALIDEARVRRGAQTADGTFAALMDILAAQPITEASGFCRWLTAYNHALMRNDLQAACRVIAGNAQVEAFAPFRGWLIAGGEAFVDAAVRDPDGIVADEPPRCAEMIHIGMHLARRIHASVPVSTDRPTIPEAASWPADCARCAA